MSTNITNPTQNPHLAVINPPDDPGSKVSPAKTWMESDKDQPEIPKNNMWLVVPSLMLVLFLAALDNTIVTTALPTIAGNFGATPGEYSWVGTSYLLVSTVMVPCWGRASDIFGRKTLLLPGVVVFFVGSALCGAAQSMTWLIGARAMQGLGGGSILSLTQIIVGDIVPLHKRGAFVSWLGMVWGIASVLGPVIGGLITTHTTWRWIFYINLPVCGIVVPALYYSLKLPAQKRTTWSELARTFDILGLILVMASCALLVVGFTNASDQGWAEGKTIGLLVAGLVLFCASLVNFIWTGRNAIVPPRLLKNRTTVVWLICGTLHASSFLSACFYFPVFFQGVEGADPLMSGVYVLPFALMVSIGTIVAGQINSRLNIVRPVVWTGYAVSALGYGLCIRYLVYGGGIGNQMGVMVLTGLGVGMSHAVPLLCIQAAMPLKEMAASTSAWLLVRSLGGTLGIAVFQAVISTGLESRFPTLQGYGTSFDTPHDLEGYHRIHDLPAGRERDGALDAFSDSMKLLWIIWTPMLGAALLLSFTTKHYSLKRKIRNSNEDVSIRDTDRAANASDVENGLPLVEMVDRDAMSEGNAVSPAVQPTASRVNSLDRLETTKSR